MNLEHRIRKATIDRLQKLRRSAIFVAADAPWFFIKLRRSGMSIAADARWSFKLRRSGMFVRRFFESFDIREICIATMNLCGAVFSLSPRVRGKGSFTNLPLTKSPNPRPTVRLVSLHASIGIMNRLQKLRSSAMFIAAEAPWPFIKLRMSGMFVRQFMDRFNIFATRPAPMNQPYFFPLPIRLSRSDRGWGQGSRVRGAVTSASPRSPLISNT